MTYGSINQGGEKSMDYSQQPIIVLGVNHSGTRVLVDVLSMLGSDGGNCLNVWREDEFFLELHRELLGVTSQDEWTRKIFDIDTYYHHTPSQESENIVREKLASRLDESFPNFDSRPWHWKCPTSALFMDFWLEQYPDAYYVHVVRDPYEVAGSLLRRRQFPDIKTALRYHKTMDSLILQRQFKNYLRVGYGQLKSEIENLLDFLPFLNAEKLPEAIDLIHGGAHIWKKGAPLRNNVNSLRVEILLRLARSVALADR